MPSNPTSLVNPQDTPSGAGVSPEPDHADRGAKELASYLNDHLAGAAAGCRLAERLVRTVEDPSMKGMDLEVQRDRDALRRLMDDLGVAQSRVKQATAVVAELASRAKLRLGSAGQDDLERLLGIEALALGVEGKLRLWRSLQAVRRSDSRLLAAPLDDLVRRAEQQLTTLEELRLRTATACLSGSA